MTGASRTPVARMRTETNLAELREAHKGSPLGEDRSVRINR